MQPQRGGGVITSKQKDMIANQKPEEKQRLNNNSAVKKGTHVWTDNRYDDQNTSPDLKKKPKYLTKKKEVKQKTKPSFLYMPK